jgi:hypothetical protein
VEAQRLVDLLQDWAGGELVMVCPLQGMTVPPTQTAAAADCPPACSTNIRSGQALNSLYWHHTPVQLQRMSPVVEGSVMRSQDTWQQGC